MDNHCAKQIVAELGTADPVRPRQPRKWRVRDHRSVRLRRVGPGPVGGDPGRPRRHRDAHGGRLA
jgi:hypothetical protein